MGSALFRDDPGERLSFHRPDAAPGVELLAARDSFEPWHVYHERYAVCAVRTAATSIRYRGKVEPVADRSVSFFEPGEVHRNLKVHKRSDFKVLFLDAAIFEQAAEALGGARAPHFDLNPRPTPGLFECVYAFGEAVERKAGVLEQQSRFASCLGHFLGCTERPVHVTGAVGRSAVRRVQRYLVERYNHSVTLEELVTISGISKFHLVRAFSEVVGLPPHAYQLHVRIERARGLLRKGLLPIETAMAVGFADQSHLTRHFRKMWGITPGAYARLH
jgi:AraC-like DNA-binding protein